MKRKIDDWFKVRVRINGVFRDLFYLAKDKDHAGSWGIQKYGKIYGVEKVQRDDLYRDIEYIKLEPDKRGLEVARNVYEDDINLTEMLFGEPKIDVREREKKRKDKLESEFIY